MYSKFFSTIWVFQCKWSTVNQPAWKLLRLFHIHTLLCFSYILLIVTIWFCYTNLHVDTPCETHPQILVLTFNLTHFLNSDYATLLIKCDSSSLLLIHWNMSEKFVNRRSPRNSCWLSECCRLPTFSSSGMDTLTSIRIACFVRELYPRLGVSYCFPGSRSYYAGQIFNRSLKNDYMMLLVFNNVII